MPTVLPILILFAQLQVGPEDAYVRVVDVGAGLCTITAAPGGRYMVYDAGHWSNRQCIDAVRDVVTTGVIDLLVISHADSDHLGNAAAILEEFEVRRIITTGYQRWDTATWRAMQEAIAAEVLYSGASVQNLRTAPLVPGSTIALGDATVTLVAGWPEWTATSGLSLAERRNAISIVLRLDYQGHSVLYGGDTVGRRSGDSASVCKDAEAAMVQNAATVAIKADVLIAPHHGADNGSADCFIAAVDPTFVIFSAGAQHRHPRAVTAERYLTHGVTLANIFRTDRGDDEGGDEWDHGRVPGCRDASGDDHIEILLPKSGSPVVAWARPQSGC